MILTRTFLRLFPSEWEYISAMTAPVRPHVGECRKTMWNAMIELCLVWIRLCIRLRDTLRDNFRVTLLVTSVLAI